MNKMSKEGVIYTQYRLSPIEPFKCFDRSKLDKYMTELDLKVENFNFVGKEIL